VLKRYLDLISFATFETESGSSKTWNEVSEGTSSTVWPKAAHVVKPAGAGEAEVLKTVSETPGTIGYADLGDARASGSFTPSPGTGGPHTERFWATLQNDGVETTGKLKYADPSSNKDVAAGGEADCTNTEFSNWAEAFPPYGTYGDWSTVSTSTFQKHYPLCDLVYVVALHSYSPFSGTTPGEALTVNNFLRWVLDTKAGGGQKLIVKGDDYEPLAKGAVQSDAQRGTEQIKY
jgi:ABC-type phosphate transport system substrate-binding protein